MSETDETDTESNYGLCNYRKEMIFLKTKCELEINDIKKLLDTLPAKNIRTSRKNLTDEEIKQRNHKSSRHSKLRNSKLKRLEELTDELDSYEISLRDDELKSITELIDKRKELGTIVNADLEEEKERLQDDLLYIDDDNKTLQAKILEYKNALKQVITENDKLKQEQQEQKKYIQPQFTQQQYNNCINGYTIPSAVFPTPNHQQKPQYINSY